MEVTNNKVERNIPKAASTADIKQYTENWIWRAVDCLVQAPDFEASPKWAAKRLNVSVEKVVEALEGLERLGHIRRTESSYQNISTYRFIDSRTIPLEEQISIHSKLAPQIISKLDANSKYACRFFLGDQKLVDEYAPKFASLFKEMSEKAINMGLTEVIASEISFAVLSKANDQGGAQ